MGERDLRERERETENMNVYAFVCTALKNTKKSIFW